MNKRILAGVAALALTFGSVIPVSAVDTAKRELDDASQITGVFTKDPSSLTESSVSSSSVSSSSLSDDTSSSSDTSSSYADSSSVSDSSSTDSDSSSEEDPYAYLDEIKDIDTTGFRTVDIVFAIDTSGSMSSYYSEVCKNIVRFINRLAELEISPNITIVDYNDTYGATWHTVDGSHWTSDYKSVQDVLNSLVDYGGWEYPSDAMEAIFSDPDDKWYEDTISKYMFLLTDEEHDEGDERFEQWAKVVESNGVTATVVGTKYYKDKFTALYDNENQGTFIDIDGDFGKAMVEYADYINSVLYPFAISTPGVYTAVLDKDTGKYSDLNAGVSMLNKSGEDKTNAFADITLPNGFTFEDGSKTAHFNTASFKNEATVSNTWKIRVADDVESLYTEEEPYITFTFGADGLTDRVQKRYITIGQGDNRIDWSKDNFAFTNDSDNFNTTYSLDELYLNRLSTGMSNTVWANLVRASQLDWDGACYGMSAAATLLKAGYLEPSNWQEGVTSTYGLSAPINNSAVNNLISYYQLSQFLPDSVDRQFNTFRTGDQTVNLKDLINNVKLVKDGGLPVNFVYYWNESDVESSDAEPKTYGHSVVAYDAAEGEFTAEDGNTYKYKLSVYDPDLTEESYVYVSSDCSDWYYDNSLKNAVPGTAFAAEAISDIGTLDIINAETGKSRTELNTGTSVSTDTAVTAVLDNYEQWFIDDPEGTIGSVELTDSDGNILPTDYFKEIPYIGLAGKSGGGRAVTNGAEQAVTITPKGTTANASVTYSGTSGNVSGNITSASYDPMGKYAAEFISGGSVTGTSNSASVGEYNTITAEIDGSKDLSVTNNSDGVYVDGRNLEGAEIQASNQSRTSNTLIINENVDSVKIVDKNSNIEAYKKDKDGNYTIPVKITGTKDTDDYDYSKGSERHKSQNSKSGSIQGPNFVTVTGAAGNAGTTAPSGDAAADTNGSENSSNPNAGGGSVGGLAFAAIALGVLVVTKKKQ